MAIFDLQSRPFFLYLTIPFLAIGCGEQARTANEFESNSTTAPSAHEPAGKKAETTTPEIPNIAAPSLTDEEIERLVASITPRIRCAFGVAGIDRFTVLRRGAVDNGVHPVEVETTYRCVQVREAITDTDRYYLHLDAFGEWEVSTNPPN